MMTGGVISWWYFLCALGAFNIVAWALSAAAFQRRRPGLPADVHRTRRLQLLLSAVYVLGCAFRSALPVYDVPRLCLVDNWLSSVMIGRSVATVAEMCFVAQWALMLREISRATGSVVGRIASLALVPLIAVAETCSWYSVLTTANIGHVAEESIWGLTAALLVAGAVTLLPRVAARRRPLILAWCVAGIGYVAFMFTVDVPMYWARWVSDQANGRHYLSIAQGLMDVTHRRIVSFRWEDWQNEVAWMSLYFSVAVWISISFIHAAPAQSDIGSNDDTRLPSGSPAMTS
jgi:hypothetical protein